MMIFGIHIGAAVIWLAVAIVLFIIEAATVGLTTIWFAAGALAAFVLALLDIPVAVQIAVFLAVSVCLLVFTRKIFVDKLHAGSEKTNTDALPGLTATVEEDILPMQVGQVRLNGQMWSAVCRGNEIVSKGSLVEVKAIEGVKLVVAPAEKI